MIRNIERVGVNGVPSNSKSGISKVGVFPPGLLQLKIG